MGKPLRLLMVEDNPSDAALVLHNLRRAGYDPVSRRVDTEEAYREQLSADIEIILCDFNMPEFDSVRAFAIMQEMNFDIPFIIVSGSIGEEHAVIALQRGASDYIIKDRMERLGKAVTNAIEQKRLRDAKRQAEQSLRASEELMRNVFDYANMAMVVTDLESRTIRANNAFAEMFGYTQAEVPGLSMIDLTHPDDRAATESRLKSLLAGKVRSLQIEKQYLHKNGQVIWSLASISLIRDAQGRPLQYIAQLQDISERMAAETALRISQQNEKSLEEKFRQSQKMEAVGQLAAGVAHDFNNFLTIILGYSDLMLDDVPPEAHIRESIGQIRKAGERAAALTRQLLAFGRKQMMAPVVLDLNLHIAELQMMLRRLIGADIELVTELQEGLGRVKIDPGQVEQLVMNLMVNARDAMPTGGRIVIQTVNVVLSELQVQQNGELPPGNYSQISVTDTGCGMTPETLSRIFEPFFTTKEVGKGTGLGLATVFGIVKQSGGTIEVESKPDEGSTFRAYFPQVNEAARIRDSDLRRTTSLRKGGETILLVEDEEGLRILAQRVLAASGYKVMHASHGAEAIQVCRDYGGTIDLLLTDVVMPRMSGRQLSDFLVQSRPAIKVLYMSGYTDDTMVRHGIQDEETNFLAKPFTPLLLAQKVRDVLDGAVEQQNIEVASNVPQSATV